MYSMVLTFLSEWGAHIRWRFRAFGHSIQPPPGFWLRATGREGGQRVMCSAFIYLFIYFSLLPNLLLYWSEWKTTVWSDRTLKSQGSVALFTPLCWCHKTQSKHYGLEWIWIHKPFHLYAYRWIICSFNLLDSADLSAALCSPFSNCEGCAVHLLLLCRVLQPTVTFQ